MTAPSLSSASGVSPSKPGGSCKRYLPRWEEGGNQVFECFWPLALIHKALAAIKLIVFQSRCPAPADNHPMSSPKVLFGFHAVGVRLKTAPKSIIEIYYEATRRDARMRQFLDRAREAGARLIEADSVRIAKLAGSHGHQGVAARVEPVKVATSLDELLEDLEAAGIEQPLLLVLDGVTDPHNLGACLRVADGAGAHAVIAPKDHAVGINATVAKVASGAAETMPYFMVTNLARTLNELKERNIWCIGTSDDSTGDLYQVDLKGPVALVLGAEGDGMRQLTRKTCDELVSIPMKGAVESLNVSVASGVCLYEALRQRT